jgi:hypothetical protein
VCPQLYGGIDVSVEDRCLTIYSILYESSSVILGNADGLAPWIDVDDLLPGQVWGPEVAAAVRASDVVIFYLSKNSVTKASLVTLNVWRFPSCRGRICNLRACLLFKCEWRRDQNILTDLANAKIAFPRNTLWNPNQHNQYGKARQ